MNIKQQINNKKNLILSIGVALLMSSCGGGNPSTPEGSHEEKSGHAGDGAHKSHDDQTVVNADLSGQYQVDASSSALKWKGTKLGGNHHGLVSVQSGEVVVEKGQIKTAQISIDLNTIKELDASEEYAAKLVGHLKSDDFFQVSSFPNATIAVTSVVGNVVNADLTIKGKTNSIQFPANISLTDSSVTVGAEFTIDRTNWGLVYGSGNYFTDLAKDKIISDDIEFEINMEAKKK
jgi:polyisoprenoid-binding protein YceI